MGVSPPSSTAFSDRINLRRVIKVFHSESVLLTVSVLILVLVAVLIFVLVLVLVLILILAVILVTAVVLIIHNLLPSSFIFAEFRFRSMP